MHIRAHALTSTIRVCGGTHACVGTSARYNSIRCTLVTHTYICGFRRGHGWFRGLHARKTTMINIHRGQGARVRALAGHDDDDGDDAHLLTPVGARVRAHAECLGVRASAHPCVRKAGGGRLRSEHAQGFSHGLGLTHGRISPIGEIMYMGRCMCGAVLKMVLQALGPARCRGPRELEFRLPLTRWFFGHPGLRGCK